MIAWLGLLEILKFRKSVDDPVCVGPGCISIRTDTVPHTVLTATTVFTPLPQRNRTYVWPHRLVCSLNLLKRRPKTQSRFGRELARVQETRCSRLWFSGSLCTLGVLTCLKVGPNLHISKFAFQFGCHKNRPAEWRIAETNQLLNPGLSRGFAEESSPCHEHSRRPEVRVAAGAS